MSKQPPKFKFAAVQLAVTSDKAKNLTNAESMIRKASENGAQVISLPECWNCPYGNKFFGQYSESVPDGESSKLLQQLAKELKVVLIGGSIPETDEGKLYNTSVVFDENGNLLSKFRKIHLFDVDIPNGVTFIESKTLSPGNSVSVFDTKFGRFGLAICYDMRFPLLAQLMTARGATFLVYPGAFNLTTGPLHWELLIRGRAVDNQLFVAAVSPARDEEASYQAWGHSTIVSPWGKVLGTTEHQQEIVYADIDMQEVEDMRKQIPTSTQQRNDLYNFIDVTKQTK